jgi:hypothetical protein
MRIRRPSSDSIPRLACVTVMAGPIFGARQRKSRALIGLGEECVSPISAPSSLQPRVRLELGQKIDSTQQPDVAHKETQSPIILPSRYPHTLFAHSQWPQDKLPVLSATPPGNWLPLLPRSAPLSRPSTLLRVLPPRPPSLPNSSRPAA